MTHDILPADVELANKLRNSGHSDDEVITALVHRGIDQGEAAQLLDDLRNGRQIKTKAQLGLETSPRLRSRGRRSTSRGEHSRDRQSAETQPSPAPEAHRESRRSAETHEPAKTKRKFKFWPWVLIAIVCVCVAIGTLLIFNHGQFEKGGAWANRFATPASAREVAGNELNTGSAGLRLPPDEVVFEFRPAGLHLGGINVTRENALKVVSDFLGQPTRSIPGKATGTVNYAFDDYGLVICSEKDGVNNSILLDCDAVGGATGTKAGFRGSIRADSGEMIRPDTHSRTLAAIKSLRLNQSAVDAGILDGRFNNLNLVFVYLKSADRLSAIEIDFK